MYGRSDPVLVVVVCLVVEASGHVSGSFLVAASSRAASQFSTTHSHICSQLHQYSSQVQLLSASLWCVCPPALLPGRVHHHRLSDGSYFPAPVTLHLPETCSGTKHNSQSLLCCSSPALCLEDAGGQSAALAAHACSRGSAWRQPSLRSYLPP
ncbi:hypothetical protein INR49_020812, partial [Caranx melampygus]